VIIDRIEHAGTKAFPEPISVDFTTLPEVVAIHGPTGAGKTTLLDLIPGSLHLSMPFRPGTLHRNFTSRGYIRTTWRDPSGEPLLSNVLVDPKLQRVEPTLHDAEGKTIAGPKQADYLREIVRRLGSIDLFLATAYAVQPSYTSAATGFSLLRASRSERKAIMVELLNLREYGPWEAFFKDQVKLETAALEAARADLAVLEEQGRAAEKLAEDLGRAHDDEAAARRLVGECEQLLRETEARLVLGEQGLAGLPAKQGRVADRQQRSAELLARIKDFDRRAAQEMQEAAGTAEQRAGELRGKITDVERRVKNNREVLRQELEIRAASIRLGTLREKLTDVDARIVKAVEAFQAATAARAAAVNAQLSARADLNAATKAQESAEEQVKIIDTVPCGGEGRYAECRFLVNAAAARENLPKLRISSGALKSRLDGVTIPEQPADGSKALREEKRALEAAIKEAAGLADLLPHLDVAKDRLEELGKTMAGYQDELARVVLEGEKARERTAQRHAKERLNLTADAEAAARECAEAQEEVDQLRGLAAEVEALREEVARQRRNVAAATERVSEAARRIGALQEAAAGAHDAQQKLAAGAAAVATLADEVSDWVLLGQGVGSAGIPALRIDEALPDINEQSTELLAHCFGEGAERYVVEFSTQRESKSSDKLLDAMDVRILRGGSEVLAEVLSGGQGVLVSEAISLAITLYQAKIAGRAIRTLMRDEVSAPLDRGLAPSYVSMLRHAVRAGAFHRALFVSHHERAIDAADARLLVDRGRVSVA
jgi:DNA repair exonuclease SbcCD ATPase subunit